MKWCLSGVQIFPKLQTDEFHSINISCWKKRAYESFNLENSIKCLERNVWRFAPTSLMFWKETLFEHTPATARYKHFSIFFIDDDIIIIVVVVCSLTLFFLLILAIFLRYQRDRDDEVGQDIGGGVASSYRVKNPNESPNPGMYRKSLKYDDIDIGQEGPAAGGSRQELGDIPDY